MLDNTSLHISIACLILMASVTVPGGMRRPLGTAHPVTLGSPDNISWACFLKLYTHTLWSFNVRRCLNSQTVEYPRIFLLLDCEQWLYWHILPEGERTEERMSLHLNEAAFLKQLMGTIYWEICLSLVLLCMRGLAEELICKLPRSIQG